MTILKRKRIINDLKEHGRQQAWVKVHSVGGKSKLFLKASTFCMRCEMFSYR